ncbi:MAG TPA: hypothetical protein PKN95_09335 [Verrucomicrobiota bacterium]|nr:hypothetical protein [Verrucomicrobiota bacterium]HNT15899.1 hypothetical protein [Verrucomicrobiota bacterium]
MRNNRSAPDDWHVRPDAATPGNSESTVKNHLLEIFPQLGVETRGAAGMRVLEAPGASPAAPR